MDDTLKRLTELRYITERTGSLHPLQMKNIQMWGYLTIPNSARGMEVYFDFDNRAVSYSVTQPLVHEAPALDKLGAWIRELLGPEYVTVVEYKGGQTYRSKRLKPVPDKSGNEPLYPFEEPVDE
jgi:hypothetical protein